MLKTDLQLFALIIGTFLLFASAYHNPLSLTTAIIAALLIVGLYYFNIDLDK
jgi:predicted membrane protein